MSGRIWLVAMATAVALACLPAAAQDITIRTFYTGNALWSQCTSKSEYQTALCAGFVAGIADAMGGDVFGRKACIPVPVSMFQARDVVKRYLEQHPEGRHHSAVGLVADALEDAFPCKP